MTTVAEGIGSLYRQARQTHGAAVAYLLEAGVQLRKQKAAVGHGNWLLWVKDHQEQLGFGDDTAQKLMRAAQQFANAALNAELSDEEASRINRLVWRNEPEPTPYLAGPPVNYVHRVAQWTAKHDPAEYDTLDADERSALLESITRTESWLSGLRARLQNPLRRVA